MDRELQEYLTDLRAVVGYLGEHDQFDWWQSSFFGAGSTAFLSPVFPRTHALTQIAGVTQAAARSHDERIGVGSVYHLFRLPEELEQSIHRRLSDSAISGQIVGQLTSGEAALAWLRRLAQADTGTGMGPIRIGDSQAVYAAGVWSKAAILYWHGFREGFESYPYFSDRTA